MFTVPEMDAVWGWHGWEWQGWEALVAVGTLLLAIATGSLAWKTREVARETRDLAKVDKDALQAQSSPLLISDGELSVNPAKTIVRLKSVGTGPAVIARKLRPIIRLDDAEDWTQGEAGGLVTPTGDKLQLEFALPSMPIERAVFEVSYTDVAGGQFRRTRILVLRNASRETWEIVGFALYNGHAPVEPTLMSGPWRPHDTVAD